MSEMSGIAHRCEFIVEISLLRASSYSFFLSSYYACLCGHLELVEYLLSHGARCDASTFDGERFKIKICHFKHSFNQPFPLRCIYGALTDQIRTVLLNFNVLTSRQKRREPFQEFLRRLMESEQHSDVTFKVHSSLYHCHRSVMSARSKYFKDQLQGRWKSKREVSITHAQV